jgi:hypothetical protein
LENIGNVRMPQRTSLVGCTIYNDDIEVFLKIIVIDPEKIRQFHHPWNDSDLFSHNSSTPIPDHQLRKPLLHRAPVFFPGYYIFSIPGAQRLSLHLDGFRS